MRLLLLLAFLAALFCTGVSIDHVLNGTPAPMFNDGDYFGYQAHIRFVLYDQVSPILLPLAVAAVSSVLLFEKAWRRIKADLNE